MPKTKHKPSDELSEKMVSMLIASGYCMAWEQKCPKDFYNKFRLECWIGNRGAIIVQHWESDGVSVYSENGIPNEWDKLEQWLTAKE